MDTGAARAVLTLRLDASAAESAGWLVHLQGERIGLDQQLKLGGASTQIAVPVALPAGRSRVELSCKSLSGTAGKLTLRHAEIRFGKKNLTPSREDAKPFQIYD